MNYTGKIHLILGPMYSGKTTELLRLYRRYYLAGKKCLLIKHKADTRYDSEYIVTHDNQKYKAINTEKLRDIIQVKDVTEAEVLCIDEIQFYDDAAEVCDLLANYGKIVIASGLNGDFKREPFEQISLLLPKVDDLSFIRAICTHTGKEAPFSRRISNEKEVKVIGGSEKYVATSRLSYYSELTYDKGKQIEKI